MARSTVPLLLLVVSLLLPLSIVAAQSDESTAAAETSVEPQAAADAKQFIPPQIILGSQKKPIFPPAAWDARYTGAVLLEMTVLKDGTIGMIDIVRCTTPKVGFEEAAVAAVKSWRFEPGMEDGEPIEVQTRLKMNFSRSGVGVRAQPQVSAGSFSVESRLPTSVDSASRSFASGSGGDPK